MFRIKTMMPWMLADMFMVSCAAGIGLVLVLTICLLPFVSASGSIKMAGELKQRAERNKLLETALVEINQGMSKVAHASESLKLEKQQLNSQIDLRDQQLRQLSKDYALLKNQKRALDQSLSMRNAISQEVLGLKGDLSRVVFVIDTSESMGKPIEAAKYDANWKQLEPPWEDVIRTIAVWLERLPVGEFRIVCFDNEVVECPSRKGEWFSNAADKSKAIEFISRQKPDGLTFTEQAIQVALSHNPTSVILFTDGEPSDGQGNTDLPQQTRLLKLIGTRSFEVPCNVVAISNYLNARQGTFLRLLARESGGGFVGF